MLMTSTNAPGMMIQGYDLKSALSALLNEGLLLIPTDTLWCIACDATDPVALERLRRLRPPTPNEPIELLFNNLERLNAYVDRLHPRLEVLLAYHSRPLTVLAQGSRRLPRTALLPDGGVAIRLSQDLYCQQLIEALDAPLATIPAHPTNTQLPTHFGRIRSDFITAVDYVARHRQLEKHAGTHSVMVRLDEMDELEFLRE